MSAITIEIAAKTYPAQPGSPAREIFSGFRLDIARGEFLALLGPSGLGKTTLLNIVAGLDADYRGSVRFEPPQPRIAYAFQNPRLLPWRSVLDNVALVLPAGAAGRAMALDMLREVELGELAGAFPERLSLGQQRRVALARAFALEPDILLMDEPFTSLDEATASRLRDLLRRLLARRPATVMFVTHDSREAAELASRVIRLEGAPVRIGSDQRAEPRA